MWIKKNKKWTFKGIQGRRNRIIILYFGKVPGRRKIWQSTHGNSQRYWISFRLEDCEKIDGGKNSLAIYKIDKITMLLCSSEFGENLWFFFWWILHLYFAWVYGRRKSIFQNEIIENSFGKGNNNCFKLNLLRNLIPSRS